MSNDVKDMSLIYETKKTKVFVLSLKYKLFGHKMVHTVGVFTKQSKGFGIEKAMKSHESFREALGVDIKPFEKSLRIIKMKLYDIVDKEDDDEIDLLND